MGNFKIKNNKTGRINIILPRQNNYKLKIPQLTSLPFFSHTMREYKYIFTYLDFERLENKIEGKYRDYFYICLINIFNITKRMFRFLLFLTLLLCFQTQKTDQFNYEAAFSDQSEVTMVITSCGRMDFLRKTIDTFFATNDYPLYGIILIDDCQTNFSDLKSCFPPPTRHQDFENSIKIIVNEKNLKLTKSIDRAYA